MLQEPFSFPLGPPIGDGSPAVAIDTEHIISAVLSGSVGVVMGFLGGLWRADNIKKNIKRDLDAELGKRIDDAVIEIDAKLDGFAGQFRETLTGLRQQINDVRLEVARDFVHQDRFDAFRTELLGAIAKLDQKLDRQIERRP